MIPLYVFARAASEQDFRGSCIRMMAFLGRYGHQQVPHMLQMPVTVLAELGAAVGEIMESERDQFTQSMADGGSG